MTNTSMNSSFCLLCITWSHFSQSRRRDVAATLDGLWSCRYLKKSDLKIRVLVQCLLMSNQNFVAMCSTQLPLIVTLPEKRGNFFLTFCVLSIENPLSIILHFILNPKTVKSQTIDVYHISNITI